MTNVVEIELPGAGTVDSNRSALHALIAAGSRLGITPGDIGGSMSIGPRGRPTVVIYDDVPGGAGHARYLMSQLEAWVAHAVEIVRSCSCGEDTSCYGCLRNYRNQLVHDTLSRRGALDVFERLLARR